MIEVVTEIKLYRDRDTRIEVAEPRVLPWFSAPYSGVLVLISDSFSIFHEK